MLPLQGVCSEAASFDLAPQVLAGCIQEVKAAREVAVKRREDNQLRSLPKGYGGCGLRVPSLPSFRPGCPVISIILHCRGAPCQTQGCRSRGLPPPSARAIARNREEPSLLGALSLPRWVH